MYNMSLNYPEVFKFKFLKNTQMGVEVTTNKEIHFIIHSYTRRYNYFSNY